MNKKLHLHVISPKDSIKDAMIFLNKAPIKTLLVLYKGKLVATLSDGDIRRGIISGKKIESKISEICNYNFKYVNNINNKSEIKDLFKKFNLPLIPIVNHQAKLIDIIYKGTENFNNLYKDNLIFILAGGEGTRLLPLTKKLPKPILKVGKLSIIEIIFNF